MTIRRNPGEKPCGSAITLENREKAIRIRAAYQMPRLRRLSVSAIRNCCEGQWNAFRTIWGTVVFQKNRMLDRSQSECWTDLTRQIYVLCDPHSISEDQTKTAGPNSSRLRLVLILCRPATVFNRGRSWRTLQH